MDEWIISLIPRFDGYGMLLYILLTSVIAGLLSSIIGLERELKGQAAGLRTHVLVTIACSLLMSLSMYAIRIAANENDAFKGLTYDASRIAAGILGGVGFIGAGTIVKSNGSIRGLTTAATIWLSATIGMACGAGFVLEALLVTLIAIFFLTGLHFLESAIEKHNPKVRIVANPDVPLVYEIRLYAEKTNLIIKNLTSSNVTFDEKSAIEITVTFVEF